VGAKPDDVDAEFLEVIELFCDSVEIADAVAVGVAEGAWVDLIDHGLLPPGGLVAIDALGCGLGYGF